MSKNVNMKPTSVITARILGNGKVLKYFTNTCYRYMDKYVPYESGPLRNQVIIEDNSITYTQLYARYQYKGRSIKGKPLVYKTPGTGSYWDRKMVSAEFDQVVQEVQKYIDRGCKL